MTNIGDRVKILSLEGFIGKEGIVIRCSESKNPKVGNWVQVEFDPETRGYFFQNEYEVINNG